MMDNVPIKSCEEKLARMFGRKHCILTGRGATALWMIYSYVAQHRQRIIVPALMCLSPLFALNYAGIEAVYADILETNATIDPDHVNHLLNDDPKIGAVLAVHLYGHQARMEQLKEICQSHGVLLIEDAAQALGGRDDNHNLLGSLGEVSILSFGHTKILDLGSGGAILTDNDEMAEFFENLNSNLVEQKQNVNELASIYSRLYYTLTEASGINVNFLQLFDHFPGLFKPIYFKEVKDNQATIIEKGLDGLESEIEHRRKIAGLYNEAFASNPVIIRLDTKKNEVPWRYTFRVKADLRESILKEIRTQDYDASSWYPAITNFTDKGRRLGKGAFPNAYLFQDEVINLWVTKEYHEKDVFRISEIVSGVAT